MALLPSALSASAMVNSDIEESLECAYLICDLAGTNTPKGVVGIRQPPSISRAFEIPFLAELGPPLTSTSPPRSRESTSFLNLAIWLKPL
jgi:hypothetical protein